MEEDNLSEVSEDEALPEDGIEEQMTVAQAKNNANIRKNEEKSKKGVQRKV